MKRLLLALALASAATAQAQTIGVHLATLHVPHRDYNDLNLGLYVKTEHGLTFGMIPRNSMRQFTAYAGVTIEQESGPFALTAGVIYGYQRRKYNCIEASHGPNQPVTLCARTDGSPGALAPMLNPSVRLPAVLGLTPRITIIPPWFGGPTAVHLSVERAL